MSAKKDTDVWAHFGEGGALSVDVVSRSEAEELSVRVAQLEDEVRRQARRDLSANPGGSSARASTDRDGARVPGDNSEDRPSRGGTLSRRKKSVSVVDAPQRVARS